MRSIELLFRSNCNSPFDGISFSNQTLESKKKSKQKLVFLSWKSIYFHFISSEIQNERWKKNRRWEIKKEEDTRSDDNILSEKWMISSAKLFHKNMARRRRRNEQCTVKEESFYSFSVHLSQHKNSKGLVHYGNFWSR